MNKKSVQLGMNVSTAQHRLRVDLIYSFVERAGYRCHRCGGELSRDTFSIEHIQDWLDSDTPSALFFDLANIAFSHKFCNTAHARKPSKKYFTADEKREAALRHSRECKRRNYDPIKSREQQQRWKGKKSAA